MARVMPFKQLPLRTRLRVMLAGLCPRCRGARIFRSRLTMNETCPACGLRFERESGYFTGAMYVSYILALPVVAVCWAAVYLVAPNLAFGPTVVATTVLFLPFVPALFRYSRILWIHFDQTVDPS